MLTIYDIKWTSVTAGPSPYNNKRTELFLFGCNKAAKGNPCKECFNPTMWKVPKEVKKYSPIDVANNIKRYAPNKFITIVGGEPLDQIDDLLVLCKELKHANFHIIVFTHHKLKDLLSGPLSSIVINLLKNIDILVDGEYIKEDNIYDDESGDGLHDAIGSSNQYIWDCNYTNKNELSFVQGLKAGDLAGIYVCDNFSLKYITKEDIDFERLSISYKNRISA